MIHLSKKDIVWGYFAQFFSIASGIITLPIILNMLSKEEIGMNYLMLTIGTFVSLFDFGFSPQFSRNITYVFSGTQTIKREGIENNHGEDINYRLLKTMIDTAKFIYCRLALIVFIFLLTFGSLYIFKGTNCFTNIHNALLIWLVYCISVFFNIYYTYYTSLLIGRGLIMESKKAVLYSRLINVVITIFLLSIGFGLLAVSFSNLISPFVGRYLSYHYFYTKELSEKINFYQITKKEKLELINIIWYNAKKLGLVYIGSYAITKFGLFIGGLFLSLSDIASYGLMIQLVGLISTISSTLFCIYEPRFSALRIKEKKSLLLRDFSFTMGIYYLLFILGGVFLIFFVPKILDMIKSNADLPSIRILILYLIVIFLEGNHFNFSTIIVTNNNVPFMWAYIFGGIVTVFGSYFTLKFSDLGVMGLVLIQGIVQISYNNWKWPLVVCKEFKINFMSFILQSIIEVFIRFKKYAFIRQRL